MSFLRRVEPYCTVHRFYPMSELDCNIGRHGILSLWNEIKIRSKDDAQKLALVLRALRSGRQLN